MCYTPRHICAGVCVCVCFWHSAACGLLVGSEPRPSASESRVLTTGPLGKSLQQVFNPKVMAHKAESESFSVVSDSLRPCGL